MLSGLSTVVQLHAPQAYRGRVLSFYLVALGVAYPIGSLIQGPVVDRIGIGWTTTGTALLLTLVLGAARPPAGGPPGAARAAPEGLGRGVLAERRAAGRRRARWPCGRPARLRPTVRG